MPLKLVHDIRIDHSRDYLARQDFVAALRRFVLNDMADAMKDRYEEKVKPAFARANGRDPENQDEIHAAMRKDVLFKFYSSTRYNAQEMCWRSVIPAVEEKLGEIKEKASVATKDAKGSLKLDPNLAVPKNIENLDVHLMPGGYASEDEIAAGAVYDNGLTVFTAGMLGPDIDDIGQSMSNMVKHRFPDLQPKAILDCGCTIGHHTVPWKQNFPDAEVYGVDVAGPVLSYAHARAESLGVPVHFRQMDATTLDFPDESMDVIFSSQFLHELSLKGTKRYLAEARRVLKPGGLLVTMELPPNKELGAYDQFYLDWDSYYNKEPFYRAFRDQDPLLLIQECGWSVDDFTQLTVPQYTFTPKDEFAEAVCAPGVFDGETGRLSHGFRYFSFILRKPVNN